MRTCKQARHTHFGFFTGAVALGALSLFQACGPAVSDSATTTTDEVTEVGNQISDVSTSVDESGGASGNLAAFQRAMKTYARISPREFQRNGLADFLISRAEATTCSATTFSACSGNQIVRTFGGCTTYDAIYRGTVTLTWGGASAACHPTAAGDTITRDPEYTITGPKGGTFLVTKSGAIGERITLSDFAATATRTQTFSSDGIRRVVKTPAGDTIYDYTHSTVSAVTVTGTSRTGRTMTGGTVRVLNNLTGSSCDYSPTAVTWTAGCNCPTSGSWAGSCSDGRSSNLQITGCGTGSVTLGSVTKTVRFDRCL
jgi:hypothetical protein